MHSKYSLNYKQPLSFSNPTILPFQSIPRPFKTPTIYKTHFLNYTNNQPSKAIFLKSQCSVKLPLLFVPSCSNNFPNYTRFHHFGQSGKYPCNILSPNRSSRVNSNNQRVLFSIRCHQGYIQGLFSSIYRPFVRCCFYRKSIRLLKKQR